MIKPEVWSLEKLKGSNLGNAVIWTRPYLRERIEKNFSFPLIFEDHPPTGLDTLIVIGGGVLMDKAKVWRKLESPQTRLVAIPSVWGSGAENSPIAVLNVNSKKVIYKGSEYLPEVRVIWKELADGLSYEMMQYACGDVWAHALEAFFSPIASEDVKNELSGVIKKIVEMPVENNEAWFEYSALACALQSKASLGLVHGIAHVLEGILKDDYPAKHIGHAALCATYIGPVMELNSLLTDKIDKVLSEYGINKVQVMERLKKLHDKALYDLTIPVLEKNWINVLREPTTRTNCAFIRPSHTSFFTRGVIE